MTNFSKVSDRAKLKPRRDPYWQKISKGCYLGFRKMTSTSAGTWSARSYDEATGKQVYRPLDDVSGLPDNQRHDAAQKAALEWFQHLGKGGGATVVTVADACRKYVSHLRETKSTVKHVVLSDGTKEEIRVSKPADDAQSRFDSYVLSDAKFSRIELSKLTPAHMEKWRKHLKDKPTISGGRRGKQRTDSTLNRDMTCLRAALNLAYRDGWVTSDFAWRGKLIPIQNADQRRDVYLDADQRRKLVSNAATDLQGFLRSLCLVPIRPGAMAALTVASYDQRLKTLSIGKDKAGQDRKIMLPDVTAKFFADHCKGKLPSAPLLARADGKAWDKDAWKKPVKAAAVAAELPATVTAYALRHSTITDMIHGGLDALTVAQLSGTSVLMIGKHYGHLTGSHSREALARLAQ